MNKRFWIIRLTSEENACLNPCLSNCASRCPGTSF